MDSKLIFKGHDLLSFRQHFKNDEVCYAYLASLKWHPDDFKCEKCGCLKSCRGRRPFERCCKDCRYIIPWTPTGFVCNKCGTTKWCSGRKYLSRRCKNCSYDESPTAATVFDKCKFPIQKAFY